MLELLTMPEAWTSFLILTLLELILGIDNIIFISILVDKLDPQHREKIRKLGLLLAMFMRIGLLFTLSWIIGLTEPLFTILAQQISARDLILILGGVFLIWKSTVEIFELTEAKETQERAVKSSAKATIQGVILQIIIIDLIFSLDSIITAIGMADRIEVMVVAVVASVFLMMAFAGIIGRFISRHPSIKLLALSFLVVIGVLLVADGFDHAIPKGYLYFAMAFSLLVETLNIRMRKSSSLS